MYLYDYTNQFPGISTNPVSFPRCRVYIHVCAFAERKAGATHFMRVAMQSSLQIDVSDTDGCKWYRWMSVIQIDVRDRVLADAAWYVNTCISWPASLTAASCSGNVSKLCPNDVITGFEIGHVNIHSPGMNQVVLILYLSKSLRSRGTPTSPAYIPYQDSSSQCQRR